MAVRPTAPERVRAGLQRASEALLSAGPRLSAQLRPIKIKVDISKVPDWQRRSVRLSMAILFFGLLGHCVQFAPEHKTMAANWRSACNWAAITCIVVTAPLIGKVAQVAFDRLVGTAAGGFWGCLCFTLGFHVFGDLGGGVFISFMGALTIWVTTYFAYKRSLDQLARFVQLTYCIVAFGARPDKGALMLAMLRIGGIFAGGLFSVVAAVLVLPRSASLEALRDMKKAIKALHDLNTQVWAVSGIGAQKQEPRRAPSVRKHHRHGYTGLVGTALGSGGGGGGGDVGSGLRSTHNLSTAHLGAHVQRDEHLESHEAAIEKLFTAVYTTLARVDESLAQTKGEIYIWHFWGRYFFLPGVHWFPVASRWHISVSDMQALATCVRRVARMLWTLLLDFEEGFSAEMQAVLQRYYPAHLLSELAVYQSRAILDLLAAFPSQTAIEVDNLLTLGQVTDCLLQISDARARRTVLQVKARRRRTSTAVGHAGPGGASTLADAAAAAAAAAAVGAPTEQVDLELAAGAGSTRPGRAASSSGVSGAALERLPLLSRQPTSTAPEQQQQQQQHPATRASSGGASGGGGRSARPSGDGTGVLRHRSSEAGGGAADGGTAAPGGASGRGVFISRLLSGQPGEHVTLSLPPRRFLQQQQQQVLVQQQEQEQAQARGQQGQQQQQEQAQAQARGQQGQRDAASTDAAAAAGLAAAPSSSLQALVAGRLTMSSALSDLSDDADIFGGLTFTPLQSTAGGRGGSESSRAVGGAAPPNAAPLSQGAAAAAADGACSAPPPPRRASEGGGGGGGDALGSRAAFQVSVTAGAGGGTAGGGMAVPAAAAVAAGADAAAAVAAGADAEPPPQLPELPTLPVGVLPGLLAQPSSRDCSATPPPGAPGAAAAAVAAAHGSSPAHAGVRAKPPGLPTIPSAAELGRLCSPHTPTGATADEGEAPQEQQQQQQQQAGQRAGRAVALASPFVPATAFARISQQFRSAADSARPSIDLAPHVPAPGAPGAPAAAAAALAASVVAASALPTAAATAGGPALWAAGSSSSALRDAAGSGSGAPGARVGAGAGASSSSRHGGAGNAAAAAAGAGSSSHPLTPLMSYDRFSELSALASQLLVEPVQFEPTEEGYLAQVRWASFQFILDELVIELEETFMAASAVLQQLPYPVGGG